jgi:hypothetical protein
MEDLKKIVTSSLAIIATDEVFKSVIDRHQNIENFEYLLNKLKVEIVDLLPPIEKTFFLSLIESSSSTKIELFLNIIYDIHALRVEQAAKNDLSVQQLKDVFDKLAVFKKDLDHNLKEC